MNYGNDFAFHRNLLVLLAQRMRPDCFLELGLAEDPCISVVAEHCHRSYGVDHRALTLASPPNTTIVEMTTDEFFQDYANTIPAPDLVLVDADHSKDQVIKDLSNISKIAADNCLVLVHDTYPMTEAETDAGHCSDSYKVPGLLDWEHVTLPCPPGLTLLRMKPRLLF